MQLKVSEQDINQRLDKYLARELGDLSRTEIQKRVKAGLVEVNKKIASAHLALKEGDEIVLIEKPEEEKINNFDLKIIHEEEGFVVVYKPAGILMHPTGVSNEKTLIDKVIEKYPKVKKISDIESKNSHLRPGVVHRLDREVSGLVVIALNQDNFDWLKKQWQTRQVTKKYQALVYGQIENDEGKINTPLIRNKQGLMVARSDNKKSEAKNSLTEYKVLKKFINYTLVEINLKTGRTHQIRAHFKSIGNSVVADELYKTKTKNPTDKRRLESDKKHLGRIFLHAYYLAFKGIDEKRYEFVSPLPQQLQDFLNKVK